MPQMGESIFEGTITKWLKKVGDSVQRDEPLFEISTDKVDAEIPSPSSGTLSEIKVEAGNTVQINTVVAVIGGDVATASAPVADAPPPAAETKASEATSAPATSEPIAAASHGERLRSSPLVRKIAKEHQLDLRQVAGTGSSGRITKDDVMQHLEKGGNAKAAAAPTTAAPAASAPPVAPAGQTAPPAKSATPSVQPGELVPLTRMRSIIAQRMVDSKRTNAHVHTVFKIDLTRIVKLREKGKGEIRAAQRREADIHAIHHACRGCDFAQDADRQCLTGR